MGAVQQNLAGIPGRDAEVGQPIFHRIDHLLSARATLRTKTTEIREAMAGVPGVVNLLVEPQVGVPEINLNRQAAAAVGLGSLEKKSSNRWPWSSWAALSRRRSSTCS